jgi:glycosyltransferase involved in cell wall biosynthesis
MTGHSDVDTLTAVYEGVQPTHFREALTSLAEQTMAPARAIVVADGPLTEALESVLDEMREMLPLEVLRQSPHQGSGPAKQRGIEASDATFVAIADADDVSSPERLERQLELLSRTGADLTGAAMEEFDDATGETRGLRSFPTEHDDLVRLLRRFSPINHPTVVMRRSLALEVGGYLDLPYLEDYDLWARMVAAGALLANADEPLVRFRGGSAALRRRRAPGVARSEWRLQRNLMTYGQIGPTRATVNFVARSGFRLLPHPLMDYVYRRTFLARGA